MAEELWVSCPHTEVEGQPEESGSKRIRVKASALDSQDPETKGQPCERRLYLDDILPRMCRGDQLLSVVVQLGDGGLLRLQTFTDEVLQGRDTRAE